MDSERWGRVKTIFQNVVEREPIEWDALVSAACAACAGDTDLRADVDRLLAAHAKAHDGAFLDSAHRISQEHLASPGDAIDDDAVPERIGPYRIVRELGHGGMGTVYLAERDDPGLRKLVALKVVHAASRVIVRRFRTETQILAVLEHPGIARLYDGGTTEQGLPYFVMEYVAGANVLVYCEAGHASIRDRLRLFVRICDAVQYAHQNFIVHRDLKPSNILVTEDGQPRLLDFGIAKALSPSADAADDTELFARVLTPQYASPEQIRGELVTTASDVYALGVILYELLSEQRPYRVTARDTAALERVVCEEDPPPPSQRAPEAMKKALRGDLDNIVLKALRKRPGERYATAAEFAADVQRHLDGYPVHALPARRADRAVKFVRRHRAAVAAAAVAVVALITGLGVSVWQARVATAERQRAERRFNDVRQLANALIFQLHDTVAPLAGSTPARQQIVNEGLKYLERLAPDSAGDPALQVELGRAYIKIGAVQGRRSAANLGDTQGAIASFTKAKMLLAPIATRADASPDVFGSYLDAIRFHSELLEGEPKRAAAQLAAEETARFTAHHPQSEEALGFQAVAEFQLASATRSPASLPHWQKAGAIYDALLARKPDDPRRQRNAALVEKYVGGFFETQSDYAAALPHHLRALALDQQRYSASPTDRVAKLDLAIDLSNIAYAHWKRNALGDAVDVYRRSLAMRDELLTSDPKDNFALRKVAYVHYQLGGLLRLQGSVKEATDHLQRGISLFEQAGLQDDSEKNETAEAWVDLAKIRAADGDPGPACEAFLRAFRLYSVVLPSKRIEDGQDPLADVARRSAACGNGAAADWLSANAQPSKNHLP